MIPFPAPRRCVLSEETPMSTRREVLAANKEWWEREAANCSLAHVAISARKRLRKRLLKPMSQTGK